MDRNTVIGLTLIFLLFIAWQQIMAPSQEEIEAQQRIQDSIAQAQDSIAQLEKARQVLADTTPITPEPVLDSASVVQQYGAFANAAQGEEKIVTLENDLLTLSFSTKGGVIKEAVLKEYSKVLEDTSRKEYNVPLKLLEDPKNTFEYLLTTTNNGTVNSSDLIFTAEKNDNSITFRADAGSGRYLEQTYTVYPGTYKVDYDLKFEGLDDVLAQNQDYIQLNWINYLDKLELNTDYERNFSSGYYKVVDDHPSYCNCRADDTEELDEPVKWISHVNQFFNSSLIAESQFLEGVVETVMLESKDEDLKIVKSQLKIPFQHSSSESFAMHFYIGPNEFSRLRDMGHDLDQVIPFGSSILGTINRWVIRPIFNLLLNLFRWEGITILVLTLLIKLALYPLTYKMLYSQSKMGALKPHLEGMRNKFKDDPKQQQMEQMKLYREFGVNPLGGCLPMVLQMPIWIALYRFFPASIEFRQAEFLWASDLSSYDSFFLLPFTIPFGVGDHISLFTLLWAITTLIYTYYNTRHMDMSANPAMKYMQYVMPLFFMGFFNSFASGLTCYLLFSNLINITQTIVTKNYIINQDKIREELEAYRKKPKKKKKGFQARLEEALKEQQRLQAEKETQKKGGKKSNSDAPKVDLQKSFEKIISKLDNQLAGNGSTSISSKSSRTILTSISDLEKLLDTEDINPKKAVNRTTAKKLRGLLTEVETVVNNQPDNKVLAKIDVEQVKRLKARL